MSSNENLPGGLRGTGALKYDTVDKIDIVDCRTCGQKVMLSTDGSGELVGIDDDGHVHPCREV